LSLSEHYIGDDLLAKWSARTCSKLHLQILSEDFFSDFKGISDA